MFPIIAIVLLLALPAFATNFSVCAVGPAPTAVRLQGCDDNCLLRPGDSVRAQVDIRPGGRVTSLQADLYAAEAAHLLDDSDGCAHLVAGACPIEAGHAATYAFNATVRVQALGKLTMHFTLTDQAVDNVACFDLQITVVNGTAWEPRAATDRA
ncbi:uncharacterized protein LOC134535656 [Bacillus rossius redtenbacheri]|uniref:uncharacterized protein LOC134535656 n=1 Tax=Bacillus rossius redtenbacheri TaxID=93214 RepID=UPI002FDE0BE2